MPLNESLQVLLGWLSPPPVSLFWTSKHVNKFVCCILIYPSCPAKQTCCCNVLFWHNLQLLYFLLRNFCDQRVCLPFKGSSICHTSLQQTSYCQACFVAWDTVFWVQSAETAREKLSSAHLQHYYLLASLTMACSATAPFTRKYVVGKPPKGEVHSNCKASSLFPSIAAACNTSHGDEIQVQQQYIVGVLGMHTLSAKLVNRAKYRCILYQPSLPVTPCLGLPW